MKRIKLIKLTAAVQEPIGSVINPARIAMSDVCNGIDDMHLLGNKALVVRAEIYPYKLPMLYTALESIEVTLNKNSLPDKGALIEGGEYLISLHITSFFERQRSSLAWCA